MLDFANVTGDPDVAWLGAGIAETVTSDLAALNHFRVIDRWRVAQAGRRTNGGMHEMAAALGASLIVTGSYQRIGPHLRITARLVDLASGEAIADAKVDGPLEDVFRLQDGITVAFARDLGVPATPRAGRLGVRETSSLDAYRAYTEGWLKIESLDTTLISDSIRDFERAIAIDPRYAIAYTGIANAEFVAYEMTRAERVPNLAALESGIEHARHAIHLDDRLAEAHATLAFLLSSALTFDEARRAGQQAVMIEPDNWRHHYRLGHATWGEARLNACTRAIALYPQFAYASLEMAMVHVARGDLETAQDVLREGVMGQDRPGRTSDRFPAIGFHWMSGVVRAARGDAAGAIDEFNLELSQVHPRRFYGPEYAAAALVSRGHAELALGQSERARETFAAALTHIAGYGRALVGLSLAESHTGRCGRGRRRARSHPRGDGRSRADGPRARGVHDWRMRRAPPMAIPPRPSTPWNACWRRGLPAFWAGPCRWNPFSGPWPARRGSPACWRGLRNGPGDAYSPDLTLPHGRFRTFTGPRRIFLTSTIMARLIRYAVRSFLWMLTHTIYRIRIVGREHVPAKGPALIISNHISMIDGALVGASINRTVRFLVYGPALPAARPALAHAPAPRDSRHGGQPP